MIKRIAAINLFMFMALAGVATANDISGKWIAVFTVDIELNFKVDGTTLKGTVKNPLYGEMKIRNGKIDGNTISFLLIQQDDLRIAWRGTYDGDVIRFSVVDSRQRVAQIIAYRPKTASPEQRNPQK
jgi:hypothetical protein